MFVAEQVKRTRSPGTGQSSAAQSSCLDLDEDLSIVDVFVLVNIDR
jgi:hypothetical protein